MLSQPPNPVFLPRYLSPSLTPPLPCIQGVIGLRFTDVVDILRGTGAMVNITFGRGVVTTRALATNAAKAREIRPHPDITKRQALFRHIGVRRADPSLMVPVSFFIFFLLYQGLIP
jgi:hypothetical protein